MVSEALVPHRLHLYDGLAEQEVVGEVQEEEEEDMVEEAEAQFEEVEEVQLA